MQFKLLQNSIKLLLLRIQCRTLNLSIRRMQNISLCRTLHHSLCRTLSHTHHHSFHRSLCHTPLNSLYDIISHTQRPNKYNIKHSSVRSTISRTLGLSHNHNKQDLANYQ